MLLGASALAGPTKAEEAHRPDGKELVVFCYDQRLQIVQRKLAGDCDGIAVSAERAEEIRAENIERRRALLAPKQPVIQGQRLNGVGTGFFVARDGTLLTNNHVVEACSGVSVVTPDGREVAAQVVDRRPTTDLALVRAPLTPADTATFLAHSDLAIGAPVRVAGYPDRGLAPIKPLLTTGRLGPPAPRSSGLPHFQINADIRHGNSGSPVVDDRFLVIGVVFAKVDTVNVFKATGHKVRFVGIVISNRAIFDFLDANAVDYRKTDSAKRLTDTALNERLRALVARVGCWR